MPRKVFVAGEILTAADVNTNLMDQAVMVFDDSTARGSAIPSPSEGMVTYLKDTDSLEKYTTSWVTAGGLVETKTALKTDAFSASVTAGSSVDVTGLSITHALQNANNKLVLTAFFGVLANSRGAAQTGLILAEDGTAIAIGDSSGSRTRVTAGSEIHGTSVETRKTGNASVSILHSPGDTSSHTYTVQAVNIFSSTYTVYINRSEDDTDTAARSRTASSLILMEVAV